MANGAATIPFEMVVEIVSSLSLEDKDRLFEILNEQIAQEEEEYFLHDPEEQAAIEQALKDYESGNYMTLEEYNAQRSQGIVAGDAG